MVNVTLRRGSWFLGLCMIAACTATASTTAAGDAPLAAASADARDSNAAPQQASEPIPVPDDAPAGSQAYVSNEVGDMSLGAAIDAVNEMLNDGDVLTAVHAATAVSELGDTQILHWAGTATASDGMMIILQCSTLLSKVAEPRHDCPDYNRLAGGPAAVSQTFVHEGDVVQYVWVSGLTNETPWLVITTDTGATIVASTTGGEEDSPEGESYAEWRESELGKPVQVQLLTQEHQESWSTTTFIPPESLS